MSAPPRLIDPPAIVSGALVALAVAVAVRVVGAVIDPDDQSNVVLVLYAAVMVGFAFGGRRAARRRPDAPFSNGALAALAAYGLVAIVVSITRVARGETLEPLTLVFNGFMAAAFGIMGALVGTWRGPPAPAAEPPRRRSSGPPAPAAEPPKRRSSGPPDPAQRPSPPDGA